MSDAAFKKAFKGARRTHKERGQIASRARLGLLEKHKDYVLRARDYHSKEGRLKRLREKAATRNPDEFYHKMVNTKVKDGVHQFDAAKVYTADELKIFKGQDIKYVQQRLMVEKAKIKRIEDTMHFVDEGEEGDSDSDNGSNEPNHLVFVNNVKAAKRFNASDHFDTHADLMDRKSNRPLMKNLKTQDMSDIDGLSHKQKRKNTKQRELVYAELDQRIDRHDQLKKVEAGMQIQKNLMGKGRRYKVHNINEGDDDGKLPVYRWKKERKR